MICPSDACRFCISLASILFFIWCSFRTRIRPLLAKCFIDQMVYAPFSITSFVTYATVLGGGGVAAITKETARNLREIFLSTWLMDWKVWPAANLVMFR